MSIRRHNGTGLNAEEIGHGTQPDAERPAGPTMLNRRRALAASILALPLWRARSASADSGAVSDLRTYREALARLAPAYRYALVDIRADWCAVCHRIEREILVHPSVQELLVQVPVLNIDVTAMDRGNRELLSHLRASGPPTFFIIEVASGGEYENTRSVGSFKRSDLIRRLQPFALAMRERSNP